MQTGVLMKKGVYPDLWVENIYEMDLNMLKGQGIKGFIFDIDNTLVANSAKEPAKELIEWVNGLLKQGFKASILSNASNSRVERFVKNLGIEAIGKGRKPLVKKYRELALRMGLEPREIAMVGDQIFTDIWGGNRFGAFTVLVDPVFINEPFYIKLKRIVEIPVMRKLRKNGRSN
ncbi:MAG: YqeG family HAD IIIA-type phosphatase [Clostridiales bacterium]|jgi:HAD superfamily phosphatase (TIGR01668 family)|nr:YqeG family HAD IIIA-type phosphatase [Clostridiales bacterium]